VLAPLIALLVAQGVLDALDVRAHRQPVPVIEVAVLGQRADRSSRLSTRALTSRWLAPGSTRQ
jgi:hypothetical protein